MTSSNSHASAAAAAPAAWAPRAMFTVALLGIAAGVQMSDFGLQSISLSAIQKSFDVSDTQLGALQGLAGVLVGSALAIPLARFADRFSRKRVLLALILASTLMMVLSALAPSFPLFFIGRSAAGITEFAMVPLVYSMIPDLAPERHRVLANLSFAALMAIGASAGFYFSGHIVAAATELIPWPLAPWRKAFLLLSLAGVPLLVMGLFTLDPPRRVTPAEVATAGSLRDFLWQRRVQIGLFVGVAGCLLVAVQALNQMVALGLERRFGATPAEIGEGMGRILLITSLGSLPVAGALDRLLARRLGQAVRPFIMGTCVLATIPVLLMLLSTTTLNEAMTAITLFLFLTCVANALVPTMLQDLAPVSLRARCFAIWSFVVSLFSASGPLIAGSLSTHVFGGQLMQAITATAGVALAISAFCALQSFLLARRTPADKLQYL